MARLLCRDAFLAQVPPLRASSVEAFGQGLLQALLPISLFLLEWKEEGGGLKDIFLHSDLMLSTFPFLAFSSFLSPTLWGHKMAGVLKGVPSTVRYFPYPVLISLTLTGFVPGKKGVT